MLLTNNLQQIRYSSTTLPPLAFSYQLLSNQGIVNLNIQKKPAGNCFPYKIYRHNTVIHGGQKKE